MDWTCCQECGRLQTVTFVYWSQLPWEPSRSNHYTLNQQDLDGQLQELLLFLTDFKFYCIISLAILVNVCFNERKLYKLLALLTDLLEF